MPKLRDNEASQSVRYKMPDLLETADFCRENNMHLDSTVTHEKKPLGEHYSSELGESYSSTRRKLNKSQINVSKRREGAKQNMSCCGKGESNSKCLLF